jgi:hypothetical protein
MAAWYVLSSDVPGTTTMLPATDRHHAIAIARTLLQNGRPVLGLGGVNQPETKITDPAEIERICAAWVYAPSQMTN